MALGVWRNLVHRVPLRYEPAYWALVFPVGMYGAATYRMLDVIRLGQLRWLPQIILAATLIGWTLSITGLVGRLARTWRAGGMRI